MYNTYADDIYRYLLVHVRDQHLAEDLTSDTFVKAWNRLETFDFKQPRPWLYTIARNTMNDHWRKKQPESLGDDDEHVSDAEPIEETLDKQQSADEVKAAVNKLPQDMRSIVTMRFTLGYSAKKTAESLGTSEGNVRVMQYRALKKLKGLLE
jgi:RNA polymerase sigma-70 factor (ECF subfamily)